MLDMVNIFSKIKVSFTEMLISVISDFLLGNEVLEGLLIKYYHTWDKL